jgi:shikimate dehydrogenase
VSYLGVIGHPLKHSLSAVFQQAALDHLGLDVRYETWPTPPDRLAETVEGLRAVDRLGANVTIPHKEAVMPLLDEVDDLARRVGAVNTIANRAGRLHGHNTDVDGFLRALQEDASFDAAGCRAILAGAGGAARAVVVGLIQGGAASVTIIGRTFPRAARLVEDLRPVAGKTELHALPDAYTSWLASATGAGLLVNCTPVGMAGTPQEEETAVPEEAIHSGALIYDLVYRPRETKLMTLARNRGARLLGGLPMLIYQGAASFKVWMDREAPVDIMLEAARKALDAEGGS